MWLLCCKMPGPTNRSRDARVVSMIKAAAKSRESLEEFIRRATPSEKPTMGDSEDLAMLGGLNELKIRF